MYIGVILGALFLNPNFMTVIVLLIILNRVETLIDKQNINALSNTRRADLLNETTRKNEVHLSDTNELIVNLIEAQEKQIRILTAIYKQNIPPNSSSSTP